VLVEPRRRQKLLLQKRLLPTHLLRNNQTESVQNPDFTGRDFLCPHPSRWLFLNLNFNYAKRIRRTRADELFCLQIGEYAKGH
jgi:hypothetical protein